MGGAVHQLQECGFTPAECARLVALRERVHRRRAGLDSPGSGTADEVLQRRLAFARWLVEHGRLGEFGADGSDTPASARSRVSTRRATGV